MEVLTMSEKGSNPFDDVVGKDEQQSKPKPKSAKKRDNGQSVRKQPQTDSEPVPHDKPDNAIEKESGAESTDRNEIRNSHPNEAFTTDEMKQKAVYLKKDTEKEIDDFKYDVEGHLRRAYDVRKVAGREMDTAIMNAVVNQLSPEQVAALIVEERGYSP